MIMTSFWSSLLRFHDAVYAIPAGQISNEEASAWLALRELSRVGLEQEDLNQIARLVRLTETHVPGPRDPEGSCCATRISQSWHPIHRTTPTTWLPYVRSTRSCRMRNFSWTASRAN